jgi:hypothetical protein
LAQYSSYRSPANCDVQTDDQIRPLSVETNQADWILTLALRTPPKHRMSTDRRLLHDHKPRPLQVAHYALRGNGGGYVLGGAMFSLATLKPERERN